MLNVEDFFSYKLHNMNLFVLVGISFHFLVNSASVFSDLDSEVAKFKVWSLLILVKKRIVAIQLPFENKIGACFFKAKVSRSS